MKIIDGIKTELDEIHGVMLIMQNIIKGLDTPCGICIGCEAEDSRKGICESFILKENTQDLRKNT